MKAYSKIQTNNNRDQALADQYYDDDQYGPRKGFQYPFKDPIMLKISAQAISQNEMNKPKVHIIRQGKCQHIIKTKVSDPVKVYVTPGSPSANRKSNMSGGKSKITNEEKLIQRNSVNEFGRKQSYRKSESRLQSPSMKSKKSQLQQSDVEQYSNKEKFEKKISQRQSGTQTGFFARLKNMFNKKQAKETKIEKQNESQIFRGQNGQLDDQRLSHQSNSNNIYHNLQSQQRIRNHEQSQVDKYHRSSHNNQSQLRNSYQNQDSSVFQVPLNQPESF